ncbi:MAG TPA: hypothetical protein VIH87_06060 [Methylocella sp.]
MSDKERTQGKVEIKIGNLSFTAEGDQEWLGEQLSKVINAAAVSAQPTPVSTQSNPGDPTVEADAGGPPRNVNASLAFYLKSKGGETKQVQRFLATAAWLNGREHKQLDTSAVAKALSENHQKRLGNPADCLNQNVTKGFCEKKKDGGFFITPEGWKELGEEQ